MKRNAYFVILAMLMLTVSVMGQNASNEFDDGTFVVEKDSVCFSMKFQKGDKITYRVESRDSIVFDFGDALVRDRWERFVVYCDSVSQDGLFYLSLKYTDFIAEESRGAIKNVKRNNSPWSNRVTHLVIDSLGRRLSIKPGNYQTAAIAPGGAFQPHLFINIDQHCKAENESWLVGGIDTLFENGMPGAILDFSSLLRAEPDMDTLSRRCAHFRFISTANGEYNIKTDDQHLTTVAILNSGGRMLICRSDKVPVFFYQSIEQKLRVYFTDEDYKPGVHYTNATFVLESIERKE